MTLSLCSHRPSLPTLFDAIDGLCSGPALRRRLNTDAVDSDCASGLVGSLVISVVKLPFSLRRLRLAEDCARCGRLLVHYVHPDHGHDVTGAHMGHTVRIDSWAVALAARSRRSVHHDRTIGSPIQNLVAESDIAENPRPRLAHRGRLADSRSSHCWRAIECSVKESLAG